MEAKNAGALDRTNRKPERIEARFTELYEDAPEMFVSVDPSDGEILSCNSRFSTTMGFPKSDIVGRRIFDFYHPTSLETARRTLDSFRQTGRAVGVELQLTDARGQVIDVVLNASAFRDDSGNILCSRSVLHDITSVKSVERELREMKLAVESSKTGISRLDPEGTYLEVSDIYAELIGYE
ncbi:MAG: PAS domain-containing protein, partial [Planctomycetota bacterium]